MRSASPLANSGVLAKGLFLNKIKKIQVMMGIRISPICLVMNKRNDRRCTLVWCLQVETGVSIALFGEGNVVLIVLLTNERTRVLFLSNLRLFLFLFILFFFFSLF